MTQRESDSAKPCGEPASAVRSPEQNPSGTTSLRCREAKGSSGLLPPVKENRERTKKLGVKRLGGWDQNGWKGMRGKQGDPSGIDRRSWPGGPKNRPTGVRASVVAMKRGNARGVKGRRKVEAESR